jgi:hypothetical protein
MSERNGKDGNKNEEILSRRANKNTAARLRVFLATYAKTGRLRRACEVAGIAWNTHYRKLKDDPTYREAFERVESEVGQLLEDAAVEQALAGDSHLLLALLKRFRPELYRERVSAELSGTIDLVSLVERMKAGRARLLRMEREQAG